MVILQQNNCENRRISKYLNFKLNTILFKYKININLKNVLFQEMSTQDIPKLDNFIVGETHYKIYLNNTIITTLIQLRLVMFIMC